MYADAFRSNSKKTVYLRLAGPQGPICCRTRPILRTGSGVKGMGRSRCQRKRGVGTSYPLPSLTATPTFQTLCLRWEAVFAPPAHVMFRAMGSIPVIRRKTFVDVINEPAECHSGGGYKTAFPMPASWTLLYSWPPAGNERIVRHMGSCSELKRFLAAFESEPSPANYTNAVLSPHVSTALPPRLYS